MKMTAKYGYRKVTCDLIREKDMNVQVRDMPTDLLPETVVYAVCRFLRHHQELMTGYIRQSYNLRFARNRTLRHEMVLPSLPMDLPIGCVRLRFFVKADGIHIYSICFSKQ